MQLRLTFHRWRLSEPFVIARESIDGVPDALHFSDGWVEPPAPALWG